MKNTLYLIDDHTMVRNGLKAWLESHTHWKILKDFSSGTDCLQSLNLLSKDSEMLPEIIIVDVQLSGESGFDFTKKITADFPQIKIVMYSMYDTAGFVLQAKDCGAKGYISKVAAEEELVNCLNAVQRGETYLEDFMQNAQSQLEEILCMLSKQEKNIFEAILQGKSNQQICDDLFISTHTVENYTSRIYDKVNVSNREELIKKFGN